MTEAAALPALSAYLKPALEGVRPARGETQWRQISVQLRQQLQLPFVAGLEGSEAVRTAIIPVLHYIYPFHFIKSLQSLNTGTNVLVLLGRRAHFPPIISVRVL